MIHDIPAKSRLVPVIPITSPQFVYRKARETDVRLTFLRVRAGLGTVSDRRVILASPGRVSSLDAEVIGVAMA